MNPELQVELVKALTKSGANFDLICILSSLGDTLDEADAIDMLKQFNSDAGLYESTNAAVNLHGVGSVKCDLCGHVWVAVRPVGVDRLECPVCWNFTPINESYNG